MKKKAVVIGGYGHIGSYLVPRLIKEGGYDVTVISRGIKKPYTSDDPAWERVHHITCDRLAMAAERKFGKMIAEMQPDLIFDTVSYTREQMEELCEPVLADPAYAQKVKLIQIGSIWVYGYKIESPVTESQVHNAVCDYGRGKTAIEEYLRGLSKAGKLNTTVLHPGHISGDGWYPINPQANFNPQVYRHIIDGRELLLPNDGMATIHPVHADDIAGLTMAVLANPDKSNGEAFNATSKYAVTLRGYAEGLYAYFGKEPRLSYLPFEQFSKAVSADDAVQTLEHISRSPNCSMENEEKFLSFIPKHSVLDTLVSAIEHKLRTGEL